MPTQDDRNQAMLLWILTIFTGFIGPLIFFVISKDKPYVYRQAALALTFGIVVTVGYFASLILIAVLIGLLLLPIVGLFGLIVPIMGAIATSKGEDFHPPIVDGICKSLFKV